jgi:hypothetical protein
MFFFRELELMVSCKKSRPACRRLGQSPFGFPAACRWQTAGDIMLRYEKIAVKPAARNQAGNRIYDLEMDIKESPCHRGLKE